MGLEHWRSILQQAETGAVNCGDSAQPQLSHEPQNRSRPGVDCRLLGDCRAYGLLLPQAGGDSVSLFHKKTTNLHRGGEEPLIERGFSAYLKELRKNPRLRNPIGFANNTILPKRKK